MSTFFFSTTIETGPLYLDLKVEVHYERSGPGYNSTIDILDIHVEPSDEIPGLWPQVKAWLMKEYEDRLIKEATITAYNNNWDRLDREAEHREYQKAWRATA